MGWSALRNPELYWPYIVSDSTGGDFRYEKYNLMCGYSFRLGRFDLGVSGEYTGDFAFRQNDPRIEDISTWLTLKAGAAYTFRRHVIALNAEFIGWYVKMLEFVNGRATVYCYMENNKLQDPFFQQVFKPLVAKVRKEHKIALYIRGDEEKKTDKATRIEANLEPLNREGNLILNEAERDNPHMKELEDQFRLFTLSLRYPADGPDAVEGGNRIIDELMRRAEPPVFKTRKDLRGRNKRRM